MSTASPRSSLPSISCLTFLDGRGVEEPRATFRQKSDEPGENCVFSRTRKSVVTLLFQYEADKLAKLFRMSHFIREKKMHQFFFYTYVFLYVCVEPQLYSKKKTLPACVRDFFSPPGFTFNSPARLGVVHFGFFFKPNSATSAASICLHQ